MEEKDKLIFSRKDFLKIGSFFFISLMLFPKNLWKEAKKIGINIKRNKKQLAEEGVKQKKFVMVIDLANCDGCKECTVACQKMHFIPFGQEWIKVHKMKENPSGPYWLPKPCMHCDMAPCAKVCPVGATYKRNDGIVMLDHEICIGCRFCMAACPYNARFFNFLEPPHSPEETAREYSVEWNFPHRKGVTEKCIFCPAMLKEGKLPACAEECPMGAIYFGDETENIIINGHGEEKLFKEFIRQKAGFRLLEELGTDPRVWYLPPRDRVYPAPLESEKED